jgi:acyl-CoA reductase-like NAD-dependent aldehyde dehydrogenase
MTSPRIDPHWIDSEPYPQIVDGVERRDGAVHPVIDPSTETQAAQWCEATDAEVEAALAAARRTVDEGVWRRMPLARRAEVLDRVAARIREEAPRLAALEALDTGKAVSGALSYDVYEAATAFAFAAGMARDLHGDVRRSAFPPELLPGGGPDILTMRLREPAGVVCELLPWNGPLMTGSQRLAAALAAGCSIVVKAPREACISVVQLGRLLLECGLPPGVLNVVLGPGSTIGERLVSDPRVDLVSLTGSVETGRRVMELAGRNLTQVHLELGGKSPVIVFADADMNQAVPWAMMAAFVNMGEVCVAGSRLLVEQSAYDEVVERVAAMSATLPIGDRWSPGSTPTRCAASCSAPSRAATRVWWRAGAAFRREAPRPSSRRWCSPTCARARRSSRRRSSDRCWPPCLSSPRRRRCASPTAPASGSTPPCSPATSSAPSASPASWCAARSTSTATSPPT